MLDRSLNLARRLSARNEPDLLQEMFTESKTKDTELTEAYCEAIVIKLSNRDEDIPQECKSYASVRETLLHRRDSNKHDHAIAFQGMNTGQALSAMAARERGHLNPSQIQRRYTNRKSSDGRVW